MNLYKISYQVTNGHADTIQVVERSEQAARVSARRRLKEMYNGEKQTKDTITDVERIREDVPATKQQERDTLAAIKQMVADLCQQSYLATAFAGCFEDAENNIEDEMRRTV